MQTIKLLSVWSKEVKARDGRCMECGSINDLHAHHIKQKATNPELRLDIENGRTLCYSCYKKWHEANRSVRIRSNMPQRRTLIKKIESLEEEVIEMKKLVSKWKREHQKCQKGFCISACEIHKKYQHSGIFLTPSPEVAVQQKE